VHRPFIFFSEGREALSRAYRTVVLVKFSYNVNSLEYWLLLINHIGHSLYVSFTTFYLFTFTMSTGGRQRQHEYSYAKQIRKRLRQAVDTAVDTTSYVAKSAVNQMAHHTMSGLIGEAVAIGSGNPALGFAASAVAELSGGLPDLIDMSQSQGMEAVQGDVVTVRNYHKMKSAPKRSFKKKKAYTAKAATKRIVRSLMPKEEVKHYDLVGDIAPYANGDMNIEFIGPVPVQGLDSTNRVGRKIKVIALQLKCYVYVPAPAQVPLWGDNIRCDVWIDKECKGTIATAAMIYDTALTAGAVKFYNPLNSDTRKRFQHLGKTNHEIVVSQVNGTTVLATSNIKAMDMYFKVNKEVHFLNTGTPGIADISNFAFYMTCVSGGPTVASAAYEVKYYARFSYVDA